LSQFWKNGIKTRYSELKRDGSITHNNPELVHEALKGLEGNGFNLKEIEVLSCGTSLKKGEKKLIILPESARFSFAYSLLTVV